LYNRNAATEQAMQYRRFGSLDFRPSALGFGCMRLPVRDDGEIDEPAAIAMLRWAIDQGVSYVDTAWPYHGGHSERVVGLALRDGYRDRVALATKLPCWLVETPDDFDRLFEEQRARLGVERIDCYLLHNLQAVSWDKMRALGATDWLERRRDEGRIGAIGFSFHDGCEVLQRILDEYAGWEFCQLQYNYACEQVQAGTRGVELVGERGLGLVIMEPLYGGTLAQPPEPMARLFAQAAADPVGVALRWLWHKPQVSVVLSGMSSLEQARHNVALASDPHAVDLSEAELALVAAAQAEHARLNPIACTNCGYCRPCPTGLDIPALFALYNSAGAFGGQPQRLSRALYSQLPADHRADTCAECGQCEENCPQHLPIREWMPKVHELLSAP
jgi:predicted aldo/keto reductase-like oxidoreductase